jgi:hypothetical protein
MFDINYLADKNIIFQSKHGMLLLTYIFRGR